MSNKVHTLKGYDAYGYEIMNLSVPEPDMTTASLQELAHALGQVGISMRDAAEAIRRMNEVFSRLDYYGNEITTIKDNLHDLRYETENIQSGLDCRTAVLEMEISDLRSAMDAKTENPNQKGDLEIFSQIVWDEKILKILEEPIKVDF